MQRKKILIGVAAALSVAGLGLLGYYELVKAGYVRYNKYDRRERGTLALGNVAPDLELPSYEGEPIRLSARWEKRPLFLVFGSCT